MYFLISPWGGALCHHGIKGQKWGIRRWQNADGSYNEAGKKRYGVVSDAYDISKSASKYATQRVNEVRANRSKLEKRYSGEKGEQKYLDDTYGKNWQNNTSKKEVDFKRQQARSNIDEGLKFLDKTIEYYENLAKEYTSMSERFNKTSVGDISNKDIKAAKELIDAFNRSGRRFE